MDFDGAVQIFILSFSWQPNKEWKRTEKLIFFLLLKLKINILNYNLMWHATINFLLLFYSSVSLPIRLVTEGSFKDLNGTRKLI